MFVGRWSLLLLVAIEFGACLCLCCCWLFVVVGCSFFDGSSCRLRSCSWLLLLLIDCVCCWLFVVVDVVGSVCLSLLVVVVGSLRVCCCWLVVCVVVVVVGCLSVLLVVGRCRICCWLVVCDCCCGFFLSLSRVCVLSVVGCDSLSVFGCRLLFFFVVGWLFVRVCLCLRVRC